MDQLHDSEVWRLEQKLFLPEVRRSRAEVEALLDDTFLEFGRSGRTYSKAEILANLKEKRTSDRVISAEEMQERQLSREVVQITYRSAYVTPNGAHERQTLRSSIWVKREEGWRMVFHQGTPTDP